MEVITQRVMGVKPRSRTGRTPEDAVDAGGSWLGLGDRYSTMEP